MTHWARALRWSRPRPWTPRASPRQPLHALTALGTQWLHDPALHDWLQGLDALCVLLRPDRYVFATAQSTQAMAHWDLSLALTQHSTAPHHPSPSPTVQENRP
jgi:hypothetical protein